MVPVRAESGSCSSRTSELPISALASKQNFSTCSLRVGLKSRAPTARCAFQNSIIGENDTTRNVESSRTFAGPVVAHQGAHGFLRNRFNPFVHRGGKLLNEIFHEFGNIGFCFAQGRS